MTGAPSELVQGLVLHLRASGPGRLGLIDRAEPAGESGRGAPGRLEHPAAPRRSAGEHDQAIDGALLEDMVAAGVERAARHGLTSEAQAYAFVSLMLELAPNFDEHWKVRALLEDPARTPDERLGDVVRSLTEADRQELRELHDDAAFFPDRPPGAARAALPTARLEAAGLRPRLR